ncbi:MAG: cupin domain-containing protein [Caulobacteraceae bacterium]
MKSSYKKLPVGLLFAAMFAAANSSALAAEPASKGAQSVPAAAAAPAASGAPLPVRSPMFTVPLEGLKGYEGIMYITDFLPGAAAARHSHPGYEFNYILKGAVTFQVDGQPPFTLTAGQGTYNARDHIHAVKNASATEPAQLVAVLINDAGKPIAVPAP